MQQKRVILALLISTAIRFLWGYLAPVQKPQPDPATAVQTSPKPTATAPNQAAPTPAPPVAHAPSLNNAPRRTVSIKTPLYDVKLDRQGAEAVSWIIKKNKDSGSGIYSVAGNKNQTVPLELISPEGLKREPREVPLQLITGDAA